MVTASISGNAALERRIKEMLAAIEMPEFAKRYPAELSGGEAQRVALALSLIHSDAADE